MPSKTIAGQRQQSWTSTTSGQDKINKEDISPHVTSPGVLAGIRMKEKWNEMGGPRSELGLPLDRAIKVTERNGSFVGEFRGGQMVMEHDHGEIEVTVSHRVAVVFEGFGLERRQESGDEIFGTIHGRLGSLGYTKDFLIPEITLGPDGSNRIAQLGMTIYEGPPADLNIVLYLMEHDSGDRKKVREEIRQYVQKAFETAGTAIGAGAGIPVGSYFDSEKASDVSLQKLIVNGAADLIDKILGMGDDPYNQVGFTIKAEDMRSPGAMQTYRCSADPRTLRYNNGLKFITMSRDDGGDTGQISALFSIQRQ